MVPCGVPQGSILGLLLFLICVNDMEAAVSCRLFLYADDSALLVSSTSVSVREETLGHEMTFLSEWLVDNKLSIYLGEIESILFGSNKKICKQSTIKMICGDNEVAAKDNVKYLGVSLDRSLGGKYIAESIYKRETLDSNFYGDRLNIWMEILGNSWLHLKFCVILIMLRMLRMVCQLTKKLQILQEQNYENRSRQPPPP